ncbi:hypothetical protein CAPTEDRAFT_222237 [Capitella teleta]|uniref:Uncharacterized protein n=1 Tax=Capitella teleta TaxID=283909 RepID=R7U5A7_CAPTE|nr:hypothetical protein CAPTEDRAFT_222237 [Capitella teleta]|eukprot:ELT98866.1 hypothetical protein CAPTEDRAFT_222237 [Capitella teleta]
MKRKPTPGNSGDQNALSSSEEEILMDRPKEPRGLGLLLAATLCVGCGFVFGFAMEKGRGLFGMSFMAMLTRTNRRFMFCCTDFYNYLADKGILSSLVGGLTLGVGLAVSGSCPTSVFTQLGAMVPNAGYTFLGAVTGTLIYGIFKPAFDRALQPEIQESSNPWLKSPYFVMALPLVAMFGILVCAFEILIPWNTEVKQRNADAGLLERRAWPPYVAGCIIGALQVPLMLGIGETLGGSSSILTMLAQVMRGPLRSLSPFIAKYRSGFSSWWQIYFVIGVIVGAYTSASLSDSVGVVKGVDASDAFVGGLCAFLGARIAGGCTSGHGVSGMGFLSIMSFLTTASMFSGAMVTAFTMKMMGVYTI